MEPFRFRSTTVQVAAPCPMPTICPVTSICLPPMMSRVTLTAVPEELEALRRQLAALEQMGLTDVTMLLEKEADRQRVRELLGQL